MTSIKHSIFLLLFVLPIIANAQIPTEVPKPQDNSPINLSDPFELIVFVVLPILFIIFFFVWRGKKKKDIANNANKD